MEMYQNTINGGGYRDSVRWAAGVVMLGVYVNLMAGGDRRITIYYALRKVATVLYRNMVTLRGGSVVRVVWYDVSPWPLCTCREFALALL